MADMINNPVEKRRPGWICAVRSDFLLFVHVYHDFVCLIAIPEQQQFCKKGISKISNTASLGNFLSAHSNFSNHFFFPLWNQKLK